MNPDGSIALLDFRPDGVTPYMLFFKDGLELEKCVSVVFVKAKGGALRLLLSEPVYVDMRQHKPHMCSCNIY